MDTTTDTTQIDPTLLQNLIGGESSPSLIPESLITTLTIGFIVLNVLGLLFLVFYIASMIRKWKVESAVLHMQKDLAEIKSHLAQAQPASSGSSSGQRTDKPTLIAQSTDEPSANSDRSPNDLT